MDGRASKEPAEKWAKREKAAWDGGFFLLGALAAFSRSLREAPIGQAQSGL
jgi:hypothetical protein